MFSSQKVPSWKTGTLPLVRIGGSIQKDPHIKRETPIKEQAPGEQTKPAITPSRRNIKSPVTCYKCGKPGDMSFNCGKGNNKPVQGNLLCKTPLESRDLEFPLYVMFKEKLRVNQKK